MKYEIVDGVVTFLGHDNVRPVSETQAARSPHLAQLRSLPGGAELPIRPETFLSWQNLVDGVCDAEQLSPKAACEVFEVSRNHSGDFVCGGTGCLHPSPCLLVQYAYVS
jgi:hypothetical protein